MAGCKGSIGGIVSLFSKKIVQNDKTSEGKEGHRCIMCKKNGNKIAGTELYCCNDPWCQEQIDDYLDNY